MKQVRQEKTDTKTSDRLRKLSYFLLLLGTVVLIVCLVYMLFNLDRSDQIVDSWIPSIGGGILLCVISMVVKWLSKK